MNKVTNYEGNLDCRLLSATPNFPQIINAFVKEFLITIRHILHRFYLILHCFSHIFLGKFNEMVIDFFICCEIIIVSISQNENITFSTSLILQPLILWPHFVYIGDLQIKTLPPNVNSSRRNVIGII